MDNYSWVHLWITDRIYAESEQRKQAIHAVCIIMPLCSVINFTIVSVKLNFVSVESDMHAPTMSHENTL